MTVPMFAKDEIETASGKAYNYTTPDPLVINLRDIATALGNACRFAGNLKEFGMFCSVAEHSVLVSEILERQGYSREIIRHGFMHDGHEFAVFDAPRPMKPTLGDAFEAAAARADEAIGAAFALDPELFHCKAVKEADDMALVHESLLYMKHGAARWENRPDVPALPDGLEHRGLGPLESQRLFMARGRVVGFS